MSDEEEEPRPDHIVGNQNILAAINEAFDDPEWSVMEVLESDTNDLKDKPFYTFLGLSEEYVLKKIAMDGKVAYRLFKESPKRTEVTTFYPPDDENETWRVEIFDTSQDMQSGIVMKIRLNLFLKKSGISTPPPEVAGGTRRSHRNSGRVGARVSAGGLRSKARVGSATRVSQQTCTRIVSSSSVTSIRKTSPSITSRF
jgi:hypothetical protein